MEKLPNYVPKLNPPPPSSKKTRKSSDATRRWRQQSTVKTTIGLSRRTTKVVIGLLNLIFISKVAYSEYTLQFFKSSSEELQLEPKLEMWSYSACQLHVFVLTYQLLYISCDCKKTRYLILKVVVMRCWELIVSQNVATLNVPFNFEIDESSPRIETVHVQKCVAYRETSSPSPPQNDEKKLKPKSPPSPSPIILAQKKYLF